MLVRVRASVWRCREGGGETHCLAEGRKSSTGGGDFGLDKGVRRVGVGETHDEGRVGA